MSTRTMRYAILGICLVFFCIPAAGQFYLTGANPARAKWNRIRGEHFTVIYPQETDSLARLYLGLLEAGRPQVLAGTGSNPRRLPVVLNPYTLNSNGTVVWTPRRMELYTMPPANGGYAQRWEEQLALHEGRHVGQITHFTRGIFKPLGWIIGEQSPGIGVGLYPSRWFLEGDAVVAETELTRSGRGRSAAFLEYYRMAFLNGDYRTWDRWRYGSYKYYTPDIYALGYLINASVRYRTENYLFSGQLLDYYVRRFYNPAVVGAAYRNVAGMTRREYLQFGTRLMTELWSADYAARGGLTRAEPVPHRRSGYYTEYRHLLPDGSDTLLAVRNAFDRPAALVRLERNPESGSRRSGGEKVLRPFSDRTGNLQRHGSRIYWTETVPHPRWEKETFGILYAYDIRTGKTVRLSRKTYYNNPSVRPDGRVVAVSSYRIAGGSDLVGVDAQTGDPVFSVPAPDHGQLLESAWVGDTLYATVITDRGEGLFRTVPGNGTSWERVIREQRQNIRFLRSSGTGLYFTADLDGVNNLYLYDTRTADFRRLTDVPYAAYYPAVNGDRLYYSDLRPDGFLPVSVRLDTLRNRLDRNGSREKNEPWLQDGEIRNVYRYPLAEKLSSQAQAYFDRHPAPADSTALLAKARGAESRRYRKGTHLFRIHSWGPLYYNIDILKSMTFDHLYEAAAAGATLYSQNTLGTAVTMLGYSYRSGFHAGHLKFTYSGWLPVVEVGADFNHAERYRYRIVPHVFTGPQLVREKSAHPLFEMNVRVYVPVNLSGRGWQRGLIPQAKWEFGNTEYYSFRAARYTFLNQLKFSLQYYQMRPLSKAEVFPRWGFSVTGRAGTAVAGKENFGSVAGLYSYFYFPGLLPRQGLRLTLGGQKQFARGKSYYLGNLLDLPRGYNDAIPRPDYLQASLDYAIPVYLGDRSLGGIAYLQRLKIIPFADYARNRIPEENPYYTGTSRLYSAGADAVIDTYLFRIGVPLSIGLRYARTGERRNFVGLLFTTSLL